MRENAVPGGTTIAGAAPEQAVSPAAIRGGVVDTFVWLCARAVYALLALGLRLVMARVFFLSGQAKIEGPGVPIQWPAGGIDLSVTLPAAIKETTFQLFETQYADLPIAPAPGRLSLQLCRVCSADLPAARLCHPLCRRGPARLDDAAANLRRAGDVVAVARLLGVDSASSWCCSGPGRHLHRRLDPHHLPRAIADRCPLAERFSPGAMPHRIVPRAPSPRASREKRHELCKRQCSRDRAGDPRGHFPGERRRRARLRPR